MRLVRLLSPTVFTFALVAGAAACGDDSEGAPDAGVSLVDAPPPPDAAPPPDAEPCADGECDGVCVNFETDEATCGDCTTTCNGGESCQEGECVCPEGFVPAMPTFQFGQVLDGSQLGLPGAIGGFGIYGAGGVPSALVAAYQADGENATVIGEEYTLSDKTLGTPPLLATGYNVDLNGFTFDAAYYATAGTIVFDTICAEGFSGTATNVTFTGVEGLMNPTIDPDGCSFLVESVTFAFGEACTTK